MLHADCCNSVSIHPLRPILATGSGQYHFNDPISELEDPEKDVDELTQVDLSMESNIKYSSNAENSLVFWWIGDIPNIT